jgi:hypothetical protein
MRKQLWVALVGLMWGALAGTALADAPVASGTAVAVDPLAVADLGTTTRTLAVGSDVSVGDTVVTGAVGQVQLVFKDDTRLVVGPNSSLLIEAYLVQPDQSVGKFTIDALGGAFRFITGKSPKDAYQIKTSNGAIGVRGTAFDFVVQPNVRTTVVLFHGAVNMCNLTAKCVDLSQTCGVGWLAPSGARVIGPAEQARNNLRPQFQYVQSDALLRADFRVPQASGCLTYRAPPATTTIRPAPTPPRPRIVPHPPSGSSTPTGPRFPTHIPTHLGTPTYGITVRPPTYEACDPGERRVARGGGRFVCVPLRSGRSRYPDGEDFPGGGSLQFNVGPQQHGNEY